MLLFFFKAVSLMSSTKYAEKQVGYMVTSVLLNEVRPAPCPLAWRARGGAELGLGATPPVSRVLAPGHQLHQKRHHQPQRHLPVAGPRVCGQRCAPERPPVCRQSCSRALCPSVGGREFAESLAADVQRLLMSSSVRPVVRKKAALCLLRLFRRNPDVLNKEDWCAPRVFGAAKGL